MTIFLKTKLWPAPLQFFKYCVFVFLCKLSKSLWLLPSPILEPVPEGLFKPWKKRWGRLIKLTVSCSHSSSPGSCYQYWYIPRPLGIYFQLQWLAVGHNWITKSLRPWNCCLPLSLNTVVTQTNQYNLWHPPVKLCETKMDGMLETLNNHRCFLRSEWSGSRKTINWPPISTQFQIWSLGRKTE